jgi:hypothetical protein
LNKSKLAPSRINKGDTHKASPNLIRDPSVVFTKTIIINNDVICPARSIKEDFAGCWSANKIVVITLKTKARQK